MPFTFESMTWNEVTERDRSGRNGGRKRRNSRKRSYGDSEEGISLNPRKRCTKQTREIIETYIEDTMNQNETSIEIAQVAINETSFLCHIDESERTFRSRHHLKRNEHKGHFPIKTYVKRAVLFSLLAILCILCALIDFLTPFASTLSPEYIALEFSDFDVTPLSLETRHHFRSVYLLDDGETQSVLKVFGNEPQYEHSLYIQQMIETSKFKDLTVRMLGSNRQQRWIRWEAGIPTPHDDVHFFTDIPDWKEQIMHIHEALSSLGILHNDLHPVLSVFLPTIVALIG